MCVVCVLCVFRVCLVCHPRVIPVSFPCNYLVIAVLFACHCRAITVSLPCHSRVIHVSLPCHYRAIPCHYRVLTVTMTVISLSDSVSLPSMQLLNTGDEARSTDEATFMSQQFFEGGGHKSKNVGHFTYKCVNDAQTQRCHMVAEMEKLHIVQEANRAEEDKITFDKSAADAHSVKHITKDCPCSVKWNFTKAQL